MRIILTLILILLVVILTVITLLVLLKKKSKLQYIFNGSACVQGKCPDSTNCFDTLSECQDAIHYCCIDDQCKMVIHDPSDECFSDMKDCNSHCSSLVTWYWDDNKETCVSAPTCPTGDTCYDTDQKCLDQYAWWYWDEKTSTCDPAPQCPPNIPSSDCYNTEQGCENAHPPSVWWYWDSKTSTCVSASTCPTGVTCYDTEQKCENAHPTTTIWYWDSTKSECVSAAQCPPGISPSDCYDTEQKCEDAHPSTGKWYWNGSKCVPGCQPNNCYDTYKQCKNEHGGGGGGTYYSWDQVSKTCITNPDCAASIDRGLCSVNDPTCAKAPRIDTSHDIPVLKNLVSLDIYPAPKTITPFKNAGLLPFDTTKIPILSSDHEANFEVVNDPLPDGTNPTGYAILINYGNNCTQEESSDCKYGGQFWSKVIASDEATVRYDVYFPNDFTAVKGGKLPGIFGLNGDKVVFKGNKKCTHCTGSAPSNGVLCWTIRPMWREGFIGESLAVIPVQQTRVKCNMDQTNPYSYNNPYLFDVPNVPTHCTSSFGCDMQRSSYKWPVGRWNQVEIYVKLNTPPTSVGSTSAANHDGMFIMKVNGQIVASFTNILYRFTEQLQISGFLFSTFFGGGSPTIYAPTTPQTAYFRNFSILYT